MSISERQQQVDQKQIQQQVALAARQAELLAADYSQATDLFNSLSVAEIRFLNANSESFKNRVAEISKNEFVAHFRSLSEQAQQAAYKAYNADQKALIDADYDAFEAEQAVNPPVEKTAEQILAEDQAAAQAADAVAPAPADAAAPVVPEVQEKLYDGVEKLADGRYALTVDPEDGTPVEIFYGAVQADCFKALRKSKANATKELRRRKKKLQITDDLKALQVERIDYASLLEPLALTPDEIYNLVEQQKDPVTVLEATRKLRQASLSPEECARANEGTVQRRAAEQFNIARNWIDNPDNDFYNCPENIAHMQELMGNLNWGVTYRNLDLAYQTLKEQGVLLDAPEEDVQVQPIAQPASVVPVAVVPAVRVVVPAVVPAAAPASALPAPAKVLRPGSSSTATLPTRRIDSVSSAAPSVVLTVEEYNLIPAATAKQRYLREAGFKAAVDKLIADGKI